MSDIQSEVEAGGGVLRKILTDAQVRRFERTRRIGRCQEIAILLKTRQPYMEDAELDQLASELLALLSQEKVASKIAHFHAIDEEEALAILKNASVGNESIATPGLPVEPPRKMGLMGLFCASHKGAQ